MKHAQKLQTLLMSDKRVADQAQSAFLKAEDALTEQEAREGRVARRNEARAARISARQGRQSK